ncbi:MAG: DNA polymerase III subunit epsilon [Lautropia sp.]|nr:DNA polymerase III subunit epsilon [Lautropia sp.]
MRQVVLDTETTGLEASRGHRIIEIGCVEMVNRRITGNNLHLYINPEREVDEGAAAVHGMTWDDLRDKPVFAQVAEQFLAFCHGANIIIHNAAFDTGFLDAELARLGQGTFSEHCAGVTDSLAMARERYPGKRNNLDALCERLMVPNKHRTLHGALLDAELLAEVYLGMTRGQGSFDIGAQDTGTQTDFADTGTNRWPPVGLRVLAASEAERRIHEQGLKALEKQFRSSMRWHH